MGMTLHFSNSTLTFIQLQAIRFPSLLVDKQVNKPTTTYKKALVCLLSLFYFISLTNKKVTC